jgi:hypothetical protein
MHSSSRTKSKQNGKHRKKKSSSLERKSTTIIDSNPRYMKIYKPSIQLNNVVSLNGFTHNHEGSTLNSKRKKHSSHSKSGTTMNISEKMKHS